MKFQVLRLWKLSKWAGIWSRHDLFYSIRLIISSFFRVFCNVRNSFCSFVSLLFSLSHSSVIAYVKWFRRNSHRHKHQTAIKWDEASPQMDVNRRWSFLLIDDKSLACCRCFYFSLLFHHFDFKSHTFGVGGTQTPLNWKKSICRSRTYGRYARHS